MKQVERVQRVPERWPVVHLEPEIPEWCDLRVDGHVAHERRFSMAELALLEPEERVIDFHCVWGWSRPQERWTGIGLDRVLAVVGASGSFVTVHSASDQYSACLPVEDARARVPGVGSATAHRSPRRRAGRCGSCPRRSCGATRA